MCQASNISNWHDIAVFSFEGNNNEFSPYILLKDYLVTIDIRLK